MKPRERDLSIIRKMLKYCDEIDEAHNSFGKTYEAFCDSSVYRNAVSMCLMQIGELSNHLSEDFKSDHPSIPWNQIRGMRNVVAHEYGRIDTAIVWEAATDDVAVIRDFCDKTLT